MKNIRFLICFFLSVATLNSFAGPLDGVRILLAEDNVLLLMALEQSLVENGATVHSVCSGHEALIQILSKPGGFDILITDQRMPSVSLDLRRKFEQIDSRFPVNAETMPGTAVVGHIRQNDILIPAILHSGSVTDSILATMKGYRPSAVIEKSGSESARQILRAIRELTHATEKGDCSGLLPLTHLWP